MSDKSQKDPNRKHYFDQVDARDIDDLMKRLAERKAEVHLWKKGMTEDDLEVFEAINYFPEHKKLLLDKKGLFIHKLLKSELLGAQIFFKIPDGKFNYCSTAILFKPENERHYHIKLLSTMFKGQQRRNYRLESGPNVILQVKIDEEVFDGVDVSAGGLCFITSELNRERFASGKEFGSGTLRINREKWEIPKFKVVKVISEQSDNKKVAVDIKIAIEFLNLSKEVEENLTRTINSEARGEEIRKKFKLNK